MIYARGMCCEHSRSATVVSRAAVLGLLGTLVPAVALASAPFARSAAPGFARMSLGDFEVTALNDGILSLPIDTMLSGLTKPQIDAALNDHGLGVPLIASVNAYLINTGSKLILIDTGSGPSDGTAGGALVRNLRAAGYEPAQVDEIYLTHLHPDHVGGLMNDTERVFPNAILRVDASELAFWVTGPSAVAAAAKNTFPFVFAQKNLAGYITAGSVQAFSAPATMAPGFRAIATPGHSVGHTSFAVESGGHRLLIWGDIVHVASIQFDHPDVAVPPYDSSIATAIATRKRMFREASETYEWIAAAHIAFPGIGRMRAAGDAYRWEPLNYAPKASLT